MLDNDSHNVHVRAQVSPITYAAPRPSGYSGAFLNNPIRCSDTFFLYKPVESAKPFNNALLWASINIKSPWRTLWADNVILTDFNKTKDEIQLVAEGQKFKQEDVETITLEGYGEFKAIMETQTKAVRARRAHVRKEQLSQGVLQQLLRTLGRLVIEQVLSSFSLFGCAITPGVTTHNQHTIVLNLRKQNKTKNTTRYIVQDPVVVIDPFCGTGSTGVAALLSGSYFIGIDSDPKAVVIVMYFDELACTSDQNHR
jgi:hypothetical protein